MMRVYMVTERVVDEDMYAMLVVFEQREITPFHRYSFNDGSTIISEHVDRSRAAELLLHWRSQPTLKVTVTR